MLKNIVFDMGNTLIKFDPDYFITRMNITDPAEHALLMDNIFNSPYWHLLDTGDLTEENLESIAIENLPSKLHNAAHELIFNWCKPIEAIPGMDDLVRDCKNAGFGIYLLSNASLRQKLYWPEIPCSRFFDGKIVSAEHRCVKPDPQIYRLLLTAYSLNPSECILIDDIQANIKGAENAGMEGYLFDGSADKLRNRLFH